MNVTTTTPEATERLGRALGAVLEDRDVILLSGELGAGKTRFVKGLAVGWGVAVADDVVSPTFLMIEEYGTPPRVLRHVDAYRMGGAVDLEGLGAGDLFGPGGVVVVEWPERVADALPDDVLHVAFAHAGETRRTLEFSARGPRGARLLAALDAAVADGSA